MTIETNVVRNQLVRSFIKHSAKINMLTLGERMCQASPDVLQTITAMCDEVVADLPEEFAQEEHARSEKFRQMVFSSLDIEINGCSDIKKYQRALRNISEAPGLEQAVEETFGCTAAQLSCEQSHLVLDMVSYSLRPIQEYRPMAKAYGRLLSLYGASYVQAQIQKGMTLVDVPDSTKVYVRCDVISFEDLKRLIVTPEGRPLEKVDLTYVLWTAFFNAFKNFTDGQAGRSSNLTETFKTQVLTWWGTTWPNNPEMLADPLMLPALFDWGLRLNNPSLFEDIMKECREHNKSLTGAALR